MIEDELSAKSKLVSDMTLQLSKTKDINTRMSNELKLKKAEFEEL